MKDKRSSASGSVVTVSDNNNKVAEDLVDRPKLGQNQSDSRGQPLPQINPPGNSTPSVENSNCEKSTDTTTEGTKPGANTTTTNTTTTTTPLHALHNNVCSSSPKKPLKLRNHLGEVTELYDTLHNKVTYSPVSPLVSSTLSASPQPAQCPQGVVSFLEHLLINLIPDKHADRKEDDIKRDSILTPYIIHAFEGNAMIKIN
ncbi:unnamed protein product [Allacma fusca]|uniref:Uncharacterized protein n=1 Tax=Allacma fusca TaxID=39272 RepID=A0A8J2K861_9HEXA|nr:unnamed protein product [Allacma fusca]